LNELIEVLNQGATIERLMDEAHKALLVSENESVDYIRQQYSSQMRKLISELEQLNSSFLSGEKPSYSMWKQLQLDAQSAKLIAENMNSFRLNMVQNLQDDLENFYRLSYNQSIWALDQTTPSNVDPSYNLPNDNMVQLWLEEPWRGSHFSDRTWAITDQWAQTIQTQLATSVQAGDSVDEMARKIREFVGVPKDERLDSRPRASAQLYRATTIARTEMIRVGRAAQEKAYKDNSDILIADELDNKTWSTKPGLFGVCQECRDKDGHTPREILKMGYTTDEHPNGRCAWIPKLKSWDELLNPMIAEIKGMKGKIDPEAMIQPNEFGNWKPVSVEPFQEWELKYLTPNERGE
jgi:hypothetical protein